MSTKKIVPAERIRAVIEIRGGLETQLGIVPGERVTTKIFSPPD